MTSLPRPPPLTRQQSEVMLKSMHAHLSSKPWSRTELALTATVVAQITLAPLALHWFAPHSKILHVLSLRWLLPSWIVGSSGFVGVLGVALLGACISLLLAHLALPAYRLYVQKRRVWPLSCEEIRISQHKQHWPSWAAAIDANIDEESIAQDWGAMSGDQALRLMAAYQDKFFNAPQGEPTHKFVCLRFFQTPPPKSHSSWYSYFRKRPESKPQPQQAQAVSNAAPMGSPLPSQTPVPMTPMTPYPDLAALRTPACPPAGLASPYASLPPSVPTDDTLALVFLTILPHYDLMPYLPGPLGRAMAAVMGVVHRIQGVRSSANPNAEAAEFDAEGKLIPVRPAVSMSLGLVGFQFPFRSGIFFTRPLEEYKPYTTHFARDPKKKPSLIASLTEDVPPSEAFEARAARYALVLQIISDWNLSHSVRSRVDLLLHATPSSSAAAAASRRVRMMPVPVPPSYMVDLRAWAGRDPQEYFDELGRSGVGNGTLHEIPFQKAGGTANFTIEPSEADRCAKLFRNVAKKHADAHSSQPTLLEPRVEWLEALLGSGVQDSNLAWLPLAQVLQLRLRGDVAACSVVSHFGSGLVTSDIAGFDYKVLAQAKCNLYAIKLAHVLRYAIGHGVQYVDFGPTTGDAKRAVGCVEVPLVGAAMCAQVHLLWLARLAAGMVALTQIKVGPAVRKRVRSFAVALHLRKATAADREASSSPAPPVVPVSDATARRRSSSSSAEALGIVQGEKVPPAIRERDSEASKLAQQARREKKAARREAMALARYNLPQNQQKQQQQLQQDADSSTSDSGEEKSFESSSRGGLKDDVKEQNYLARRHVKASAADIKGQEVQAC